MRPPRHKQSPHLLSQVSWICGLEGIIIFRRPPGVLFARRYCAPSGGMAPECTILDYVFVFNLKVDFLQTSRDFWRQIISVHLVGGNHAPAKRCLCPKMVVRDCYYGHGSLGSCAKGPPRRGRIDCILIGHSISGTTELHAPVKRCTERRTVNSSPP